MHCPLGNTGLVGRLAITYAFGASGGAGWEHSRRICHVQ